MKEQKSIAIDFDKTLHKYSKGYGTGEIYDAPFDGARAALLLFKEQGIKIVIFSVRNLTHIDSHSGKLEQDQLEEMKQWMDKYQLPYDEFWTQPGKPQVDLFIDDKALRFEGIWRKTALDALNILNKS